MHRRFLIAALAAATACGGDDDTVPPAQARPADAPSGNPPSQSAGTAPARQSPTVTLASSDVASVRHGTIEDAIAITGDLHPIETVEIRARIEGDLIGVLAREGERVRAGQLLARFESSEQESAQASADADRIAAESERATAAWNLEQTAELFKAGAVSERDFKAAQQTVTTANARLAAAQSRLRATMSLLRDTRVVAPTSGVISHKLVENGEHVARGAGLFTLVRSDVMELAAAVPARQAGAVRVGQTVHFVADGRAFDGKVARVSPTIDPATRSVTVYVRIPNEANGLRGGSFATGRVVSRVVSDALLVPSAAIRQSPEDGRPFVYRITGRVLDIVSVQLGVIDERGGIAEVVGGLAAGDRVIVGNVGTLGRGMEVIVAGQESQRQGGDGGGATGARPSP